MKQTNKIEEVINLLTVGENRERIRSVLMRYVSSGIKEIPLIELLPDFAMKNTNKFSSCDGPNCFNALMNWFEPATGIQITHATQIVPWLRANFTELKHDAELQFGDVIVFVRKEMSATTTDHVAAYTVKSSNHLA